MYRILTIALGGALMLTACSGSHQTSADKAPAATMLAAATAAMAASATTAMSATSASAAATGANPLFAASSLPFDAPPFDKITRRRLPAGYRGRHEAPVGRGRVDRQQPCAADLRQHPRRAGKERPMLDRAMMVFNVLTGANTDPTLQKVQDSRSAEARRPSDAIYLNAKLFERVKTIYDERDKLKLDPESERLINVLLPPVRARRRQAFRRRQDQAQEAERRGGDTRVPPSSTSCSPPPRTARLSSTDKSKLAGLSDAQIAAAAQAAKARGLDGKWVITLQNTTQQPDLATHRIATCARNCSRIPGTEPRKATPTIPARPSPRLAQIRAEKAKLLGYPNYAAWKLTDQMAKTPHTAENFLAQLVRPAPHERARSRRTPEDHRQGRRRFSSSPGTGSSTPSRCARPNTISTKPDQALFRAEQRAEEWRLLCRQPALRTHLQGTPRHARVAAGRARVRSVRQGRHAAGSVLRRLLQARQQVRRRLDGQPRRPVEVAGHPAGHLQRRQLHQAGPGPAGAADL